MHDATGSLNGRGYLLEPRQFTGVVTVTAVSRLEMLPGPEPRCPGSAVDAINADGDGVDELVILAPCSDFTETGQAGNVYVLGDPNRHRVYLSASSR